MHKPAPMYGPVLHCLDRSVYGPLAGQPSHACDRCGGYHDANGRPLIGPCPVRADCIFGSLPGGAPHRGHCLMKLCPCGRPTRPAKTWTRIAICTGCKVGAHRCTCLPYRPRFY